MKNDESHRVFDELLILRAQNSDAKALELLIKRWHKTFLKYATRILKNQTVAQDIMQESWIAIVKNLKNLNNPAHFSPWAYRIIHNKAMDEFRKQKKEIKPEEESIGTEMVEDDRLEKVIHHLNAMERGDKYIMTLYYLEEMPIAEIAFVLSIPPGTVKSRLFHARNKLKKQLNIQ